MSATADGDRVGAVTSAVGVGVASYLVGLVSVTLAVSLAGAVVTLTEGTPALVTVTMVAQYTGVLAVAVLYLAGRDRPVAFLRVGRPTVRDLGWVVAGLVVLFTALTAATYVLDQGGLALPEHSFLQSAEPLAVLLLVPFSILITGPIEELVYRGIVQTRLKRAYGTAPAVLGAAAIFGLVHVPAYALGDPGGSVAGAIVVVCLLGALLGLLYEYTGNLFVAALAHGVYNAVTFGNAYLEMTGVV